MTYEQVRKRIAELVPDIKKLEFGCEVKYRDDEHDFWGKCTSYHILKVIETSPKKVKVTTTWPFSNSTFQYWDMEEEEKNGKKRLEILGRDPSLADVLRAIEFNGKETEYDLEILNGHLHFSKSDDGREGSHRITESHLWYLGSPLSGQSQETLDFIGELIK